MSERSTLLALATITACALPFVAGAQSAGGAGGALPKRDLSGVWQPASPLDGIQPNGARNMPADGKHEPPYTAFGLELFKRNKPSNGTTEVNPAEENDPAHACDPQGFPRENLFELRTTQIVQSPIQTIILYTYGRIFRIVWTDGRELPKDPDPRWFGHSVGKWRDDRGRDERDGSKELVGQCRPSAQ